MAGFQLSSFSRRFAEATRANSYVPPIAAIKVIRIVGSITRATVPGHTKDYNRSSRSCENTPCRDILLCEGVLYRRHKSAGPSSDHSGFDRGADSIFRLVHHIVFPRWDHVRHCQCLTTQRTDSRRTFARDSLLVNGVVSMKGVLWGLLGGRIKLSSATAGRA